MNDNIPGLPGYHITKDGKLYSRYHKAGHRLIDTYHLLKPNKNQRGYLFVQKRGKCWYLHRLVALAYIPNPKNKAYVCHRDNIVTHNQVDNLYWGTPSENRKQCVNEGRQGKTGLSMRGASNPNSKLTKLQRREIRKRHSNGERICDLANEYKVSRITIRRVINKYIKPMYYQMKRSTS